MKRVLLPLALAALVAAGVGLSMHGRAGTPAIAADTKPTTGPATAAPPLGVEDFMKHVDQHGGPVTVEGVVSSAAAGKGLLTLIDRREFAECGIEECAEYTLPVQWSGSMPAVKDAVRVAGRVKDAGGGKLLFVAASVEKDAK